MLDAMLVVLLDVFSARKPSFMSFRQQTDRFRENPNTLIILTDAAGAVPVLLRSTIAREKVRTVQPLRAIARISSCMKSGVCSGPLRHSTR
jgi:hypothetical protein